MEIIKTACGKRIEMHTRKDGSRLYRLGNFVWVPNETHRSVLCLLVAEDDKHRYVERQKKEMGVETL